MEDVKNTLKPLEWSDTTKRINSENTKFPLIVKPTASISATYGVSSDPVLLHDIWIVQRIVAQNLDDEGTYVVGPQMDIPNEYTGTLQYRKEEKRLDEFVQVFSSVKEIASSMPERVFPQERCVVYPVTGNGTNTSDKSRSMILNPLDQLTVVEKKNIATMIPTNRIFGVKPKFKPATVPCVIFLNELTKEKINLPVTTRGKFATKSHIPVHGRELDFKDILTGIDLPINLSTCRNCPRSPLDEYTLRSGMRLRLTNIEEHEVILGVTTQQKIVEFAVDSEEFLLPKHLTGLEDKEQEIAYQTALQRFIMECQIKNSPVNVKDYRKSIRNHISRASRPTGPRGLSQVASTRIFRYTRHPNSTSNGTSAIQLLTSMSASEPVVLARRSSLPGDGHNISGQSRMHLPRQGGPLPAPPERSKEHMPALPPRNVLLNGMVRHGSLSPRILRATKSLSYAGEFFNDIPPRPPPPPPRGLSIDSDLMPQSEEQNSQIDNTGSPSFSDEKIWDNLDEDCLRKLRAERRMKNESQSLTPYENVNFDFRTRNTDLFVDLQEKEEDTKEQIQTELRNGTISPQFTLSSPDDVIQDIPVCDFDGRQIFGENEHPQEDSPGESLQISSDTFKENRISVGDYENVSITYKTTDEDSPKLEVLIDLDTELDATVNAASTATVDYSPSSQLEDSPPATLDSIEDENHLHSNMSHHSNSVKSSSFHDDTNSIPSQSTGHFHISQYSVGSQDSLVHHVSLSCNYVPSPESWQPPDDLKSMSVTEVSNSLRYIGMNEDTVDWFSAEKVDGHLLCSIDEDSLTHHFRLSPFQRSKLIMFLKGWRPKLE